MDREPKRTRGPHAGADRHNINVTRLCLRTGSVQLPFALAGRLPEGELLAHELESDEAMVLWSEPPRRLAGLGPLFEAHEVQVNDAVILEVQGDELRVGLQKRPRRARPKVTPSTWASHRMPDVDARRQVPEPDQPRDGRSWRDDAHAGEASAAHAAAGTEAGANVSEAAGDRDTDLSRGVAEPDISPGDAPPQAPRKSQDADASMAGRTEADVPDDAPRAPRVKIKPLSGDAASDRTRPSAARAGRSSGGAERAGLFGGMVRTVRGWFGGPGDQALGPDAADATPRRAPDWTQAWDEPEEPEDPLSAEGAGDPLNEAPSRVSFGRDAARPAGQAERERARSSPEVREVGERDRSSFASVRPEASGSESSEPRTARRSGAEPAPNRPSPSPAPSETTPSEARPSPPSPADPGREAPEAPAEPAPRPDHVERQPAEAEAPSSGPGAHEVDANDDEDVAAKRAAQWQDDGGGVPSRAERFLAGDLRTRLLRFLSSPDMPLIAKTEMIASRFDLDLETARDLLQDIADDPPNELRLTPIRENAWRVERTGY